MLIALIIGCAFGFAVGRITAPKACDCSALLSGVREMAADLLELADEHDG